MPDQAKSLNPQQLKTPWAEEVDHNQPLPEYPRPQMRRESWQNLNGSWDYAITTHTAPPPSEYTGKILVPFPLESLLSGVQRQLKPHERLWYKRRFSIDSPWQGGRVLLHFGAVDWECRVYLNNVFIGEHRGGYSPFTFDITATLTQGENELVVSVWDPSDSKPIQRGKQVRDPGFIWYTTVSGIWQTVWLEHVPDSYIASLRLVPDIDKSTLTVQAEIAHPRPGQRLQAEVMDQDQPLAGGESLTGESLVLHLPNAKLWSPESPHLYDLRVTLLEKNIPHDRVMSYFGMRKFSLCRDSAGHLRFCLNNAPCFLYGPLDQGYWPDGLYTPPTDEAMRWEIDFLKKAGFNMLRKHIKVEPARYYAHCDQAGIIVWQDMVSGGISPRPVWFFFANLFKWLRDDRFYWRLGRGNPANRAEFRVEYKEILESLFNVVSLAIWTPFNEGWGQFDAAEIAKWTKEVDPTRLVDHASGWFDQGAGDFKSLHVYFKPLPDPKLESERALVLSEFGGYSLNMPEHAWQPKKEFGYKKFPSREALTQGYLHLLREELLPWVRAGLSAAVYTQTTDVETEVNGFLTYDRKKVKMNLEKIQRAHQELYSESPDGSQQVRLNQS